MTDDEKVQVIIARGESAREIVQNKAFREIMKSFQADKDEALKELLSPDLDEMDFRKISNLRKVIFFHDELVNRLSILIEDGNILIREIFDEDLEEEISTQETE